MLLVFVFIGRLGHLLCLLFHLLLLLLVKLIVYFEIEFQILFGQSLSTALGFHQIRVIFIEVVEIVRIFKKFNPFLKLINIK